MESRVKVDWGALGELMGGSVGPFTKELLCYTARSITDTRESAGGTDPESKFANAHAWVQRAYDDGVEAGVREERERWRNKIVGLFGV